MSRWVWDALAVGSAALVVGGTVAMVTTNNSSGAIASGVTGGIGTALAGRKQDQQLKRELHQKILAQVRQEWQPFEAQITAQIASIPDTDELQARIQQLEAQINQLQLAAANGKVAAEERTISPESSVAVPSGFGRQDSEPVSISVQAVDQNLAQIDRVLAYLKEQGVTVENYAPPERSPLERALNQIAIYLGNNYTSLAALHAQLRLNSRGTRFRFYLQKRTQKDIQINTAFSAMLRDHGCIAKRFYDSSTKILYITPHQQRDDLTQFFYGRWFERFIFHTVVGVLQEKQWQFECLLNPVVTFANGDRYELDLFFLVEGQPLWVECKAGSGFDQYLSQYSRQREILGVPKPSALMVVLNLPDDLAATRTEMWGVTVLNHETLVQYLQLDWSPTTAHQEVQPSASTSGATVLGNVKLRPVAKYRRPVLEQLVELFHYLEQPITLKQAKLELAERLDFISRNKIQEVLMALKFANFFLDQDGNPVKSPTDPVMGMVAGDVDELERRFVEHYTAEVLALAPTFFEHPKNRQRFQQTVGADVPSEEVLERLSGGVGWWGSESVGK
jgi:hypothetical protein